MYKNKGLNMGIFNIDMFGKICYAYYIKCNR